MWNAFTHDDYTPRDNHVDIEWLDAVIEQANEITARIIIEIMHKVRFDNGKLAESGKALVLKTSKA